jgi:hypothetical protein
MGVGPWLKETARLANTHTVFSNLSSPVEARCAIAR